MPLAASATKPLAGAQINWAHPLARGLNSAFVCNEGAGQLTTDLERRYPGLLTGGMRWAAGSGGAGLGFDGTNQTYLNAGGAGNFTTLNFTVLYKVMLSTLGNVHMARGSFSGTGWYIQASGSNLDFRTNQSGVSQVSTTTGGLITTGKWLEIAFVMNGATVTPYLNGRPITLGVTGTHIAPTLDTGVMRIGAYTDGTGNMTQQLDHAYFWDRSLSAAEIAQLYAEPFAMLNAPDPYRRYFKAYTSNSPRLNAKWGHFWGWE